MFLTLNNKVKENKNIVVLNNRVKVENAFLTINTKIQEKQLRIENNNIIFLGKSEFIVDNNDPKLDVYVNMENLDKPRNIELGQDEVELFVDSNNGLSYINSYEEIKLLKQGVVKK